MEFCSPTTLDEAFRALEARDSRCLAGGQSLVAMMNLGIASPARLVSLRKIAALRGIQTRTDGSLRIGAMTSHAEIAALGAPAAGPALLARAAKVVAYPAVRAQGTIGGAVAHADPAADYPVALVAADASIELASAGGVRSVAAPDFFRGVFETALTQGEIVSAIVLPPGPAGAGVAYEKLSLVAGDFAIASVAAIAGDGVQVAIGGCAPAPVRLAALEQSISRATLDDASLLELGRRLAEACDPSSDHRASAAYRRRIVPELVRRAVRAAVAKVNA